MLIINPMLSLLSLGTAAHTTVATVQHVPQPLAAALLLAQLCCPRAR